MENILNLYSSKKLNQQDFLCKNICMTHTICASCEVFFTQGSFMGNFKYVERKELTKIQCHP